MLLTICGGLAFGLAGCSGRDSSNTSTPTPTLSPGSSGSGGDGGGGASGESDIPGEVVHNHLKGINVVSHRASGESVEMQIENTGDEVLSNPTHPGKPGPHIWVRTLTVEGTVVDIMNWKGRPNLDNAGRVEPSVTETISYDLKADQAARYEICLLNREESGEWVTDLRNLPWEEFCGDG